MNDILKRMDEIRLMRNISKADLARELNITPTTISNWYRLDTIPSLKIVEKFCSITKISVENFFYGLNPRENNLEDIFMNEWRDLSLTEKSAIEKIMDAFYERRIADD